MPETRTFKALGLMSGSSLDGLDIAFCELAFANVETRPSLSNWQLLHAETLPFSKHWQTVLAELPAGSALQLAEAHVNFGAHIGDLVNQFLEKHQLVPDFIASHGHTIFHYPDQHFTTQIGDGAAIAARTRCTVIDNFRAQDVALGGQGAPLAPLADRMLFSEYDFCLNLGGIANITFRADGGRYVAFDIGGANQVLNALVQTIGLPYDDKGQLAASGKLNAELKALADAPAFFSLPYPKSLDNGWVRQELIPLFLNFDCPLEDKLHTLCVHLAQQIALHIRKTLQTEGIQRRGYQLLATGGGAMNDFLMACIRRFCAVENVRISIPDATIIGFKEAILMALMGALRMMEQPNCLASVTGASRNAVGGSVHFGK